MVGRVPIPIVNLTTGQRFDSTKDAAAFLEVLPSTITNHLQRRTQTLYGCVYDYAYNLPLDEGVECKRNGE